MASPNIHPTACISPLARLGEDVTAGPFCVVEDRVVIGDRCRLAAHAIVKSDVTIGADNVVGEGTVLGGRPQHTRAGSEVGRLEIGDRNTFREHVTIHVGLAPGDATIVGSDNFFMVNVHLAHDCQIGDRVIIANNTVLAGHVVVEDRVVMSGLVGIHQFVRIGRLVMCGGQAHIKTDVPPYVTVDGDSNDVVGLNVVGLRRNGFDSGQIAEIKRAYRVLYQSAAPWTERLAALRDQFPTGPAGHFHTFLSGSKRGIVQERRGLSRKDLRGSDAPPRIRKAA